MPMERHRRRATVILGIPTCIAALLSAQGSPGGAPSQNGVPSPPRTATVHVTVLDAHGQPIVDLRPADFSVTLDGEPRSVVAADYVFRGPGASAAAAQSATHARAEAGRRFIVVIDEGSLLGGDERAVRTLASRLIDRLGPADEVTVVSLPGAGTPAAFTSDREATFENLRKVAGRAVAIAAVPLPPVRPEPGADAAAAAERAGERPARAVRETELRAASDAALAGLGNAFPEGGPEPLAMLAPLLDRLRPTPGPKTVVLISAGLPDLPRSPAIEQVASAAAGARAAIQVFYRPVSGWQRAMNSRGAQPDASAAWAVGLPGSSIRGPIEQATGLAALAALTGGSLVEVGRNVDQAVERLLVGLGGDYVVTFESAETDWDGKAHDLRATVRQPRVSAVRARTR
jgi:VWFA-related protein